MSFCVLVDHCVMNVPDVIQTVMARLRLFVHSQRLKGASGTSHGSVYCTRTRTLMRKDGKERLRYSVIAQLEIAYGKVQDSTGI